MKFLTVRKNAYLITALMIIAALFSGSLRAINKQKKYMRDYFSQPTAQNQYPLKDDLIEKSGIAANISSLWNKYNKTSSAANNLESARKALAESLNPISAYSLSIEVTNAAMKLIEQMNKQDLSDYDRNALAKLEYDLKGIDDIIKRQGQTYNDNAEACNKKINVFPVKIFKTLMFIKDIEYFSPK